MSNRRLIYGFHAVNARLWQNPQSLTELYALAGRQDARMQQAYQAMRAGGGLPCVLNAANEIAVAAFLDGRIRFTDIARVVRHTLEQDIPGSHQSLEGLLDWDAAARRIAVDYASRLE